MPILKQLLPYVKEGVRVAVIMGAGDIIAQTLIENKKTIQEFDLVRTAKFCTVGMCFVGPVLRYWYRAMDRIIVSDQPPLKRTLKKMIADQACFAPIFTVAITSIVGTMNGETPQMIKDRLHSDYLTIMQRNYMLWPAAQMINFSVIPIQHQVTFASIVAIIWNCYLSLMLNNTQMKHDEK